MTKEAEESGGYADRYGIAADSSLVGASTTETGAADDRPGVDSLTSGDASDLLPHAHDILPPATEPRPLGLRGVWTWQAIAVGDERPADRPLRRRLAVRRRRRPA